MKPLPDIRSPNQIHRTLRIVRRRSWATLVLIGFVVALVISYLLFGRIPKTATGNALFLSPGKVVPFQSTGTGQILKWRVKVGEYVEKGQVLAVLEQPLIEKDLLQAQQKLADATERHGQLNELGEKFTALRKDALKRKGETLEQRIPVLEQQVVKNKELAESSYNQSVSSAEKQEENARALIKLHERRDEDLLEKLKRTEQLRLEKLATADELLTVRESRISQRLRLAELNLQLLQMSLTKIRTEEARMTALSRVTLREDQVADLKEERDDLEAQRIELERLTVEGDFERKAERSELERTIQSLKKELDESREVKSPYNGRILELTAGEGKFLVRGQRMGAIDTSDNDSTLEAVAYFVLADGKQIKPGMKIRLTPATVQRERFGSLVGRVKSVSSYPVTEEAVTNTVGNASVAAALVKDGHQIEVIVELLKDPSSPSGYVWDGLGVPPVDLSPGTVASSLVNLREQAPIKFIIPILQEN